MVPGLGALERAGGEDGAGGMRSASVARHGDAFRVETAIDGGEKGFGGAGRDWGNVVCMVVTSLEDSACAVAGSVDGHTDHEEENGEVDYVWDYVAHGVVVISNGVWVGAEGIEAFGEEKDGDLDLEGVEEVSKVLEDGNRVAEVQKVVWVVVEGGEVGIDGVLEK